MARRVTTFAELLDGVDLPIEGVTAAAPGDGMFPPPAAAETGRALVQPHCHQQAVLGTNADRRLMERAGIPAPEVLSGCCGLAGNFGAERGHESVSRAVAELALLPALEKAGPDDLVLADGFSCRTQIAFLGGRRAQHLAEILADRLGEADALEPGLAASHERAAGHPGAGPAV